MRDKLQPNAAIHTQLVKEVAEEMSNTLGRNVSEKEVETYVNTMFKFLRNCIRGGAEFQIDKLGTFKLIPDDGKGRRSAYVVKEGGYPNCFKEYEVEGDDVSGQVVYNPKYYPTRKLPLEEYRPPRRIPKRSLFGKKGLTGKRKKTTFSKDGNSEDTRSGGN